MLCSNSSSSSSVIFFIVLLDSSSTNVAAISSSNFLLLLSWDRLVEKCLELRVVSRRFFSSAFPQISSVAAEQH